MSRLTLLRVAALALALLAAPASTAQSYPERTVRIVASTAAGGQSDRLAAKLASPR